MRLRPGGGGVNKWRVYGVVVVLAALVCLVCFLLVQHVGSQFSELNQRSLELQNQVQAMRQSIQAWEEKQAKERAQSASKTRPTEEWKTLRRDLEEMEKARTLTMQHSLFRLERQLCGTNAQVRSVLPYRAVIRTWQAVMVTGADTGYFTRLLNLIGSLHFWSPNRNIVVFDLGLTSEQVKELGELDRVIVRHSAVRGRLKTYAWKAQCIASAVEEFGKVIWVDAGGDVRGNLTRVDELLEVEDNFFVQGQDEDMSPWSHDGTLAFFETNKVYVKGKYSFSGNCQGYNLDSRAYWEVLKVLEACSRIPACIAPEGSSLGNHRYDQIAMSSAIYTNAGMERLIQPHTELLAAVRAQVSRDPEVPSKMIFHTRRDSHTYDYTKYLKKSGKVFDAPKVEGLQSML